MTLKTIFVAFFHFIMVLCDRLSANHAKFASYIASSNFRYLESNLMTWSQTISYGLSWPPILQWISIVMFAIRLNKYSVLFCSVSQLNIKSIRFNAVFQVKSNFRFGPILIDLHWSYLNMRSWRYNRTCLAIRINKWSLLKQLGGLPWVAPSRSHFYN